MNIYLWSKRGVGSAILSSTLAVLAGCDGSPIIDSEEGDSNTAMSSEMIEEHSASSSVPYCSSPDVWLPDDERCGHFDVQYCPDAWKSDLPHGYFCLGFESDKCQSDPQSEECLNVCLKAGDVHEACDGFLPSPKQYALLNRHWLLEGYKPSANERFQPVLEGSANSLLFNDAVAQYAGDTLSPFQYTEDCNYVTGEYIVTEEVVSLPRGWTTAAFCSGQDNFELQEQVSFISDVLAGELEYRLIDNDLYLRSPDGRELNYTFKR